MGACWLEVGGRIQTGGEFGGDQEVEGILASLFLK